MVVLTAETEVHHLLVVTEAVVAVVYMAAQAAWLAKTQARLLLVMAPAAVVVDMKFIQILHILALVVSVIKAYASSVFRLDSKEENNG